MQVLLLELADVVEVTRRKPFWLVVDQDIPHPLPQFPTSCLMYETQNHYQRKHDVTGYACHCEEKSSQDH